MSSRFINACLCALIMVMLLASCVPDPYHVESICLDVQVDEKLEAMNVYDRVSDQLTELGYSVVPIGSECDVDLTMQMTGKFLTADIPSLGEYDCVYGLKISGEALLSTQSSLFNDSEEMDAKAGSTVIQYCNHGFVDEGTANEAVDGAIDEVLFNLRFRDE